MFPLSAATRNDVGVCLIFALWRDVCCDELWHESCGRLDCFSCPFVFFLTHDHSLHPSHTYAHMHTLDTISDVILAHAFIIRPVGVSVYTRTPFLFFFPTVGSAQTPPTEPLLTPTLLLSSCSYSTSQKPPPPPPPPLSPHPPLLFCPTSNFFCMVLVHSPFNPQAAAASLHTEF